MWKHTFEQVTDLAVEPLWAVLADIRRWPEIDTQIEAIEIGAEPREGTSFRLKPKGGPMLRLVVERFEAPRIYTDLCRLPLAAMRTTHELVPMDQGTVIRVTIEIAGPLSFVWRRIVGVKHAAGLQAQTVRFIQRARNLGSQNRPFGTEVPDPPTSA